MSLIEAIEWSGNRTWPALEGDIYDGWLLRASGGVTRRANSVTVYRPSRISLSEKVDHCERWYHARSLPTIFRTTPLTDAAVHAELDHRGYTDVDGAIVMIRPLKTRIDREPIEVDPLPSDAWWELFEADRELPVDRATLTCMWETQHVENGFLVRRDGIEAAAIGSAAVDGPFTGIFNMRTASHLRRHGHGSAVLEDLLRWAQARRSTHAYLQVMPHNHAARALYEGVGFEPLYEYRYRVKPSPQLRSMHDTL